MKRREDQPLSMNHFQFVFGDADNELTVVLNSNISYYEYMRDVLSYTTTVMRHGKRVKELQPRFQPVCDYRVKKSAKERQLLKQYKAEYKKQHGGVKLVSVKVS